MYSVILVDDEELMLQGLQKMISWNSLGFYIKGIASDGEECLAMLQEYVPDLIITDIKMRKVDGIEMVEKIRDIPGITQPKVIFLTGYNDFNYIKNALVFRANDYLLKPILEEDLLKALSSLKEELDREQVNHLTFQKYKKIADEKELYKVMTLKKADCEAEKFSSYFVGRNEGLFFTAYLWVNNEGINEEITESTIRAGLESILESLSPKGKLKATIILVSSSELAFLFSMSKEFDRNLFEYYFSSQVNHFIQQYELYSYHLAYGNTVANFLKINESYTNAKKAEKFLIYYDKKSSISYKEIENETISTILDQSLIPAENLLDAIVTGEIEKIYMFYSTNFMTLKKNRVDIGDIIIYINKLYLEITELGSKYRGEYTYSKSYLIKSFKDCRLTVMNMMQEMTEYTLFISNQIRNCNKTDLHMQEIIQYINSHYKENLTIKVLADKFYTNNVYLGQILHKQLHTSFKKYVESLRLNESKRLLKTTGKTVYEIAYEVGYNDSEYFSKVFSRAFGVTPTLYRVKQ